MRIFKTKPFAKWARSQSLPDAALRRAVGELQAGSVEANLGGNLYKKRVALGGKGKRAGARTLLVYKAAADKAFFVYGFAKNERDNIDATELKALKLLAKTYLEMSDAKIKKALAKKELTEVIEDDDEGQD